ncbi:transposase [Chitinophagaceae bacterium LWZ2-11]
MNEKFKNKYRIPSARLQRWDYTNSGSYFITICTKNMVHYFGEIVNQQMQLSNIGLLTEKFWFEIPKHFPFVELGDFVVMPNHVHGILMITNIIESIDQCLISALELTPGQLRYRNRGNNSALSISSIVGSYKSAVTKNVRLQFEKGFAWQTRFHDHVIRDAKTFLHISQYIESNPLNWNKDKFFT